MNAFLKHAKEPRPNTYLDPEPNRALYFALLREFSAPYWMIRSKTWAQRFLHDRLQEASAIEVDFPTSISGLESWLEQSFVETGKAYQTYLSERREGGNRRILSCKSHALDFISKSAPTKLVDGSWLYGSLAHWKDPRYSDLIRIYLEELGQGDPAQNHVALYRKLLKEQSCDDWTEIDDSYFEQGAIQLALAQQAEHFLPEILGFNLGYEQLPLHLPITAYELAELGIDPYYFTLHITIDNFDNGHARRALAAVKALAATAENDAEFFRRVANGYRLNWIGAGATAISNSFDLEGEVIATLTRKARMGQYLHSDRCRIEGRTINDWLAQPAGMPDMLRALEATGWIRRNEDPINSRFWKLIDGDQPLMFGVFDSREKQLIFDWISGEWQPPRQRPIATSSLPKTTVSRSNTDLRQFMAGVHAHADQANLLTALIRSMSPALHASEQGLMATRIFSEHFNAGCIDALASSAASER